MDSTFESLFRPALWESLAGPGVAIIDAGTPESWLSQWQSRFDHADFKSGKIGSGNELQLISEIRGDETAWLQPTHQLESQILRNLQALQKYLSESLYLALNHVEAHWAHYAAGTGYEKHLDQSPRSRDRQISFIHYMNENWQLGDGGELEIFFDSNVNVKSQLIEPRGGRWVFFRSADFPHQVLRAEKSRRSLTGWFKNSGPIAREVMR